MPYISKEEVSYKRAFLKKKFPEFKFSVRKVNYTEISVVVLSGPVDLFSNKTNRENKSYESVNHFHAKSQFANNPKAQEIILGMIDIINQNNCVQYHDADYGNIPQFYMNLSIGSWDKPYVIIKK